MASGKPSATDGGVEVLVIGAGPAGCAAAIWCAFLGLRVVLLEARAFPRHKPGESLHPGVLTVLRQLGVEQEIEQAGFARYAGLGVAWGSTEQFQPFGADAGGAWLGLHADRTVLDSLLLRRAVAAGVQVLQPARALSPIRSANRVSGLHTTHGPIHARFVIDATGGNHWLGRRLGLEVRYASEQLIASYGYVQLPASGASWPRLSSSASGWSWTAHLGAGRHAWVHLPRVPTAPGLQMIPVALQNGQATGLPRGADVTWRHLAQAAGPGYFLVGDAASVLDPLSSDGVLRALMSGMQAAHLIHLVLRQGVPETTVGRSYRQWLAALFEHKVQYLQELYGALPYDWQPAAGRKSKQTLPTG